MILYLIYIVLATSCTHIYSESLQHNMQGRIRFAETLNNIKQQQHPQQHPHQQQHQQQYHQQHLHKQQHQQRRPTAVSAPNYLPNGFNPQPPPVHPLLYPFGTKRSTWKPIIVENLTRRRIPLSRLPILEDRVSINGDDIQYIDVPKLQTVYGQRKHEEKFVSDKRQPQSSTTERHQDTLETNKLNALHDFQFKQTSKEGKNNKHINQSTSPSESTEQPLTIQTRQKVNTSTTTFPPPTTIPSLIIKLQNSQPNLMKMENEEPIDTSTEKDNYTLEQETEQPTEEENWMPMVPTKEEYEFAVKRAIQKLTSTTNMMLTTQAKSATLQTTTSETTPEPTTTFPTTLDWTTLVSTTLAPTTTTTIPPLNWPTELIEPTAITFDDASATFQGDSIDVSSYYDELNLAESLVPQLAVNITKVGIPYEEKNSAEDPTICVPLTVSETTETISKNTPEIIEVQRVYCFPLPLPEVKVKVSNIPIENPETKNTTQEHEPSEVHTSSQPTNLANLVLCWLMSLLIFLTKLI